MPLTSCPDCGTQVSDAAIVCPQCGFPLRREALERAAARRDRFGAASSSTNKTGLIVGLVVVGGLFFVVAIGILAAIAIPRFTVAAKQAKEQEGAGMLKEAYTAQSTYAAEHDAYARTLDELKSVGWTPPVGMRHYDRVEIASAEVADLCMHAVPRAGADVRPVRIRTLGEIDFGVRCGEFDTSLDVDAEATGVLRDVYRGVRAWWSGHERPPASEAELEEAYPSMKTDPDFAIGLTPVANGGFCVHIAPRTTPPSPVVRSMDSGGNVYAGDGCRGTPVDRAWR